VEGEGESNQGGTTGSQHKVYTTPWGTDLGQLYTSGDELSRPKTSGIIAQRQLVADRTQCQVCAAGTGTLDLESGCVSTGREQLSQRG
jgi:hypothetical protein